MKTDRRGESSVRPSYKCEGTSGGNGQLQPPYGRGQNTTARDSQEAATVIY